MPNPTGMLKKGDGDETDNKKVLEFVPYKTAPKNQNHHIIPDIYGPTNVPLCEWCCCTANSI
jgi:hypothetical protein